MKAKLRGFTVVELLVCLSLAAILATFVSAASARVRSAAATVKCVNNLRQLGAATALYLGEHEQMFFPYSTFTPEGRLWYFGLETGGGGEGGRELDGTKAALFPYLQKVGGVEVCPSFPYASALWKPKFKGASYGYGYNVFLAGRNALTLARPASTIVFGDSAQVNTFQAPATASNPLVEEFYMIDSRSQTVHFRHNGHAQFLFADGHVEGMSMASGTLDSRLPEQKSGGLHPLEASSSFGSLTRHG